MYVVRMYVWVPCIYCWLGDQHQERRNFAPFGLADLALSQVCIISPAFNHNVCLCPVEIECLDRPGLEHVPKYHISYLHILPAS